MKSNPLTPLRIMASNTQSGRCIYCHHAMRVSELEPQGMARMRFIYPRSDNRRDHMPALKSFRATTEHLQRQDDGGTHDASNIAAACMWCNGDRQDKPVDVYKALAWSRQVETIRVGAEKRQLRNFICVEAPEAEVADYCVRNLSAALFDLKASFALTYPAYTGDPIPMMRNFVWLNRKLIEGVRCNFETADQREELISAFGSRAYRPHSE